MINPLVTITIPTLNSAQHLGRCLQAINDQTYRPLEINIVDSYSTDITLAIAAEMGVRDILHYRGYLLGARHEGVKRARGKYVLILDSDQILEKTAIQRAIHLIEKSKANMLVFEENVYQKETWLEKLFDLDRRLFNAVGDLDPYTGVILPRFFETKLLKKAYQHVPKEIFSKTGGPDHAIVYYEAWSITKNIATLPNAVLHIEPSDFLQFWRKFYRWGYTGVKARSFKKYQRLMQRKEWFRTGLFTKGLFKESIGSIVLSLLKGIANKSGYFAAKITTG